MNTLDTSVLRACTDLTLDSSVQKLDDESLEFVSPQLAQKKTRQSRPILSCLRTEQIGELGFDADGIDAIKGFSERDDLGAIARW